ncbi:phage tail protein [Kitasatospora sp. NPDC001119]
MAGPGGKEAGRVHVRVLPDTDGFRDRLKRYLEMLEKYTKLSVKLDLDTGGVNARLRELTHDRQVRVNVVADTGEAAARIAALTRERRARISADADTAPAEARLRAFTGRRWRLGVNVHLARGGFDRIKSGLRDIGSGAAEVARNFGRLFTLSIEQTASALQGIGSGISSAAQGALGMAAGFAQSLAAALPLLVAVTAIASWVTVVASGLIAVLALAALPVLPIGLAAIAAAGDMKTLGDNAEEAMQKASAALKPATALMRAEFGGALRDITGWFKQAEPVLKSFFDSGAQFVRPMVKSILDFTDVLFPKLTEAMNSAGMKAFTDALPAALVGIGASLGDFFLVLANGGDRLKSLLPPLNGLLDVFLQGIASLAVQFSPEIAASISWFAGSLQQFFQVFKDNAQATAAMMRLVDLGLRALVVGFDITMTAWNALAVAAVAAWHAVQAAWDGLTAATSAAWSAVTSWTASAWASVTSAVSSAASAVGSAVSSAWASVTSWTASAWASVTSAVSSAASSVASAVSTAWNNVSSWTSSAWNSVTSWTSSAWASVTSTVSSRVSAVGSAVSAGWNNVQSWTSSAWNACYNAVTSAWSNIASGVSNGIGTVVSYVSSLPGKILGAIGDLGNLLFDKGKSAIQGLVNGMKSISVSGVVSSIVGSLNPFKASMPAAPAAAPRALAAPVMAFTAMPAAAYASPLEQALRPVASGIRSLDSYGYGQRAAAGLRHPEPASKDAGRARYGAQITVNARTNADPHEIGKAIAWELKTSGR